MTTSSTTTTIINLKQLLTALTEYEPNLTLKIWRMVAPERYMLKQHERERIISLAPHPNHYCIFHESFAQNHYLQVVFPGIKRFYYDKQKQKMLPIYTRDVKRIESLAFYKCLGLKFVVLPHH